MADPITPFVVHLISSSGFYGAERVVATLCDAMKDADVSVLCLSPNENVVAQFENNVKGSDAVWWRVDNNIVNAIKKLLTIKSNHENLVLHAHGYKEIVIACIFKAMSGCGVIVTQHGFTERNRKSRVYNWINLALCRWASVRYVLCVSDSIYQRYLDFGVTKSRLVLLANGVLVPHKVEKLEVRKAVAKQLGVTEGSKVILYAGRLSEEKDPLLFVATIKAMRDAGQEFVAVIAGDGPLHSVVVEELELLGLNECVRVLGFVDNIDDFLIASDVLLLTSKTEGTPMIILEAMMRECAVVATDVGGISNIINHEKDGLLVESREAAVLASCCIRLLEDNPYRKKIVDEAVRCVLKNYSLQSQIDGYQQRYKECIL